VKIQATDLENFFNGDPDFTSDQEEQLLRLTAALRGVVLGCVEANTSAENLASLADQAEGLQQSLSEVQGKRPLPSYNKVFRFDDVSSTYAYSPITGRANPVAPPLETYIKDDKVYSSVVFNNVYEGPPGCVHGGIVALAWDHVLAAVTLIDDSRGPTANLSIDYIRPTPLNTELRYEAWLEKHEGKKVFARGQCFANGELITEARGLFINALIKELDVTEEQLKQDIKK